MIASGSTNCGPPVKRKARAGLRRLPAFSHAGVADAVGAGFDAAGVAFLEMRGPGHENAEVVPAAAGARVEHDPRHAVPAGGDGLTDGLRAVGMVPDSHFILNSSVEAGRLSRKMLRF